LDDIQSIKLWLFKDHKSKLYIYDEALHSGGKRRAMSKVNVEIAFKIVPQLSKGRAKMIVISQTESYLDSVFYNPVFLKGVILKLSKKRAIFKLPNSAEEFAVSDIPRTPFNFDPYSISVIKAEKDIEETEPKAFDSYRDRLSY